MGEVFLFRKLVFLFWMPLIKTNDASLVVRLSQQLRKSSLRYQLERAATYRGLYPPGWETPGLPAWVLPGWALRMYKPWSKMNYRVFSRQDLAGELCPALTATQGFGVTLPSILC